MTMKKSILAGIALCAAAFTANAGDIMVVDMGRLYGEYNAAQESMQRFQGTVDAADKELAGMMERGMAMNEEYEALFAKSMNPAFAEDARKAAGADAEAKRDAMMKLEEELINKRRELEYTLAERNQAIVNKHVEDIKAVVSQYAKKHDAELVINSAGLNVLFSEDKSDITDEILKILNGS